MDATGWLENIKIRKAQMEQERIKCFQQQALLEQKLEQTKATILRLEGGIIALKEFIDLDEKAPQPGEQAVPPGEPPEPEVPPTEQAEPIILEDII